MQSHTAIRSTLGLLATLLLAACGGGGGGSSGGGGDAGSSSSTAAPTVTLNPSAGSVVSGSSVTLTWSTTDATSCTASGGWSGTKATSGSELVRPLNVHTSYILSCSGTGGTASRTASVAVTAATSLQITSGNPPDGVRAATYGRHSERGSCPLWQKGCKCPAVHRHSWDSYCRNRNNRGYRDDVTDFLLAASGGVPPYSWAWASAPNSTLPPGLTVVGSSIAGTPTVAGTYRFVVTVTDSASPANQVSAEYSVIINLPPPPVISTTPTPSVGAINLPYGFTFGIASGGQAPFTWSEAGALPPGLTFNTDGTLSGTPTATGAFPITLVVLDEDGQSATPQDFTIQVVLHGFKAIGSMTTARDLHTATLLKDGMVLITGGVNESAFPVPAELFDPASGSFTAIGNMGSVRVSATATLLDNGMVLLAGGKAADGTPLATAELFNPASRSFVATGSMATERVYHTATLLSDGRVLVAGGLNASGGSAGTPVVMAELFDPATRSFAPAGNLQSARFFQTATLLGSGKVLITGGLASGGSAISTTELFDPTTETFVATASMSVGRAGHTATRLTNGKVLVVGGALSFGGAGTLTTELFDPATETLTPTGSMAVGRALHTATVLASGKVLVTGGSGAFYSASQAMSLSEAELFDPATASFGVACNMTVARESHTATLLASGDVLVTGGANGTFGYSPTTVHASAELYH
jgi:hypothetical protein